VSCAATGFDEHRGDPMPSSAMGGAVRFAPLRQTTRPLISRAPLRMCCVAARDRAAICRAPIAGGDRLRYNSEV
jgi:hypothetical protein